LQIVADELSSFAVVLSLHHDAFFYGSVQVLQILRQLHYSHRSAIGKGLLKLFADSVAGFLSLSRNATKRKFPWKPIIKYAMINCV
jgi:hypothetical protein